MGQRRRCPSPGRAILAQYVIDREGQIVNKVMTKALATMVLGIGMVVGAAAPAAETTVWNFNLWGGKRAFSAGIETIKSVLEAAGGGAFELRISYGDALGPRKKNPESLRVNAFEAGQLCVGYYPNKFPLLSVMELPFLLPRDLRQRANIEMEVLAHPLIVEEMARMWNIRFFGPSFLPAFEFMGNTRIETVADMKGVKMRISGLNAKALEMFGAVPTMVTAPDGYTALDRGTIDSFGFPYSYAFGSYKLYEVSKYVTEGLAMSGFMCFQSVNIDVWNKTPEAVRKAMPGAQAEAIEAMIKAYKEADEKWLPIFHERLEVVKIAPSERAKLAAVAEQIWAQWARDQEAAGRPGGEILEFAKTMVAKHTQ
jgi:TRAP-type C4-dicarboxylate transport system substrate-binding protein